jgi:hypothetical protein
MGTVSARHVVIPKVRCFFQELRSPGIHSFLSVMVAAEEVVGP